MYGKRLRANSEPVSVCELFGIEFCTLFGIVASPCRLVESDPQRAAIPYVVGSDPNALPLIITHGWPGSVLEVIKAIGPLTDPTAYGGRAEDAFDVVIPSMS
jgi:hypothetical protein